MLFRGGLGLDPVALAKVKVVIERSSIGVDGIVGKPKIPLNLEPFPPLMMLCNDWIVLPVVVDQNVSSLLPARLVVQAFHLAEKDEIRLRFATGRSVSTHSYQFLTWRCTKLAVQCKTALLLVCNTASWHRGHEFRDWSWGPSNAIVRTAITSLWSQPYFRVSQRWNSAFVPALSVLPHLILPENVS